MGAGYLPERQGRANAKITTFCSGLFMRNRGTTIAWLIGYLILGKTSYGSIYGVDMESFVVIVNLHN